MPNNIKKMFENIKLFPLLSGEIFSKQLLLINTQLVTRLIKFFD